MLLPDTLGDYVGGDNEVRPIDAFVDSLDISFIGFKAFLQARIRKNTPAATLSHIDTVLAVFSTPFFLVF